VPVHVASITAVITVTAQHHQLHAVILHNMTIDPDTSRHWGGGCCRWCPRTWPAAGSRTSCSGRRSFIIRVRRAQHQPGGQCILIGGAAQGRADAANLLSAGIHVRCRGCSLNSCRNRRRQHRRPRLAITIAEPRHDIIHCYRYQKLAVWRWSGRNKARRSHEERGCRLKQSSSESLCRANSRSQK